jgi:pimeloyl-ACP methyl ester carboxylesterase
MRTDQTDPRLFRIETNGIELACFEWGGQRRGKEPTLLFAHATGFHGRCWDQVIGRLGMRHVIAIEQRGHGRSDKTEITHWRVFGQDLAALVRTLDLRDIIGVGHSMGGHAMVEAAAANPDRFRRLVLIDPVIASPDDYAGGWKIAGLAGRLHPTAKRKNLFASSDEMFERFKDRVPYSVFDRAALHDYCKYGLLPAGNGQGFVLACPPQIEASIYMTSRTNPYVYESIRALEIPVLIVRAKEPPQERTVMDFSSSPTWPGLAHEFRKGREIHFTERTHFLPMEIPAEIAELILKEVDSR